MKKKLLAIVLSMAMVVTLLPLNSVSAAASQSAAAVELSDEAVDFGPQAAVSSSGTTGDRNLESIKDAQWEPKGNMGELSDYVPARQGWGNWNMALPEEGYYYVQYDWEEAVTTNWMQLYWWDDNGGLGAPASLRILYKGAKTVTGDDGSITTADDAEWKEATLTTDFNSAKALGQYNVIKFEEISAKSIRIAMQKRLPDEQRPYINGIGICRWKVMSALNEENLDKGTLTLPEKADEDFPLPTTTLSGKPITWESGDSAVITVDGNTAKVAAVTEETPVTMTAKVDGAVFKTFIVKVQPSAEKIDLSTITVPGYPYEVEYNGLDQWPRGVGTLNVNGVTLRENVNYRCTGTFQAHLAGPKNAGEKTLIITAIEGDKLCTGSITVTYTITPKALVDENVILEQTEYTYTEGETYEPGVTVKVTLNGVEQTLEKDKDYTVAYSNNTAPGTGTVTVTGIGNFSGTVQKNFSINEAGKTSIASASVTLEEDVYLETGAAIEPVVTSVKLGENTLVKDTDYTVSYLNNEAPGTAKVVITGIGNYTGVVEKTFTIVKTLTADNVTVNGEYKYTGSQIIPDITVKVTVKENGQDVEKTLVKDTDYTVEYGANNTVGPEAGTVTVTGIGNYTGTVTKTFAITEGDDPGVEKIDLNRVTVIFPNDGKYEYTGAEIQPMATVKDGETALAYGTDFLVDYPTDLVSVGSKQVTIKPGSNGKYKGSKTAIYEISARTLTDSNTEVTLTMPENIVAGTQVKPEVSVKVTVNNYANEWYQEGTAQITHNLVKDTDYTVEYGANDTPGTATGSVTIKGKGNYAGSLEKKFDIPSSEQQKVDLKEAVVTIPSCTYNGKAQTPAVTVKVGDKTLVKDTDYTVSYANNTNAGTAKAVITALEGSAYTGTVEKSFTINKASAIIKARNMDKRIGAKDFSFAFSVNSGGKLSYKSSNTKAIKIVNGKAKVVGVGKAKITISAAATSNYKAASKSITIKVYRPKKVESVKAVSEKCGVMKVTWKRNTMATGYKVMYSTDKNFRNKAVTKTIMVKKNKTVSKTIKGLESGKRYYVRISAYVQNGNKQILGNYSNVKKVKIAK